jgi:hypothetical protein
LRTITVIGVVVAAVLLTSAFWYASFNNQNNPNIPSNGNINPNSSPTPTSTMLPTLPPATHTPTSSPEPTSAPITGTTTPSAPDFTLQYVDHSYDVPPTYKTDPYTGQSVINQAGYHQDNRTIDVTIKNPSFTPSTLADGNITALFYNVQTKGHFENWTTNTNYNHGISTVRYNPSGYTVISFYVGNWNISPGGQVDFQVQAIIGYEHNDPNQCFGYHFFTIGKSDWSSTQTITISNLIGNATVVPGASSSP